MITEQPLDMTKPDPDQLTSTTAAVPEDSPPPLTRVTAGLFTKQKTPSSPKDFFAKLYGPDEKKPTDGAASLGDGLQSGGFPHHFSTGSPQQEVAPQHARLNHPHPCLTAGPAPCLSAGPASFLGHHYPPDPAALFRLDTLPFPGGLAAFRKFYFDNPIGGFFGLRILKINFLSMSQS
jgi:hypothetical protein